MEIVYHCNIDFEEKLFASKYNDFESSKQNQEFEFLIVLLEPRSKIFSTRLYSTTYKDWVFKTTGSHLKITDSAKNAQFWWGQFDNIDVLKSFQSKIEIQKLGLNEKVPSQVVSNSSELSDSEKLLCRFPYQKSGQGNFIWPNDKNKIEKKLKNNPCVVTKLLDRKSDFSTIIENQKVVGLVENIVDEKFQYRGTVCNGFEVPMHLKTEYEEKLARVLALLKNANYTGICSIDSFIYGDEQLYFLSEINMRKTMGYVALQLKNKYGLGTEFSFLLSREKLSTACLECISPEGNLFYTYTSNSDVRSSLIKSNIALPASSAERP